MAEQVMQSQAEADEEDQASDNKAPTLVLGAVSRHSQMLAERCSLVLAPIVAIRANSSDLRVGCRTDPAAAGMAAHGIDTPRRAGRCRRVGSPDTGAAHNVRKLVRVARRRTVGLPAMVYDPASQSPRSTHIAHAKRH